MKILKILGIVVPIVIMAVMIPVFLSSVGKMQELDKIKQDTLPAFTSQFEAVLDHCSTTSDTNCKDSVSRVLQQCDYYNTPAICTDPRIKQILNS